jgi:hypothetical protein
MVSFFSKLAFGYTIKAICLFVKISLAQSQSRSGHLDLEIPFGQQAQGVREPVFHLDQGLIFLS